LKKCVGTPVLPTPAIVSIGEASGSKSNIRKNWAGNMQWSEPESTTA
jgi:hypothetical protein